jgi:hypothetical protein
MKNFHPLRTLALAAVALFGAAAFMTVGAEEAAAGDCQSSYGKLCGKTEVCVGTLIRQCTTEFYYFVQDEDLETR